MCVSVCLCVQEGYLAQCAVDQDGGGGSSSSDGDYARTVYGFGPRFHLEIGLLQLAKSFYRMLGQPPDESYLLSLREELEATE